MVRMRSSASVPNRFRRGLEARFELAQLNRLDEDQCGHGKPLPLAARLLPLFKNGTAAHVNDVELGRRGWRSNVWTYPGASSHGSDARRGLRDHPTVKPTVMLEDALLDLTNRGDITSGARARTPA